jgi:hypothetical protein
MQMVSPPAPTISLFPQFHKALNFLRYEKPLANPYNFRYRLSVLIQQCVGICKSLLKGGAQAKLELSLPPISRGCLTFEKGFPYEKERPSAKNRAATSHSCTYCGVTSGNIEVSRVIL